MTDGQLLREYAQHGSQAAFADLVRRHVDWVYSSAVRQVQDRHLAEDVTQATFVVLARRAGQFEGRSSLTGWLFKAVRFAAADAMKLQARRRYHERKAAAMRPRECPHEAEWGEIAPLLDEAIARLGSQDREAVLLRFFQGQSHKEIGQALGISEDAAKMRLSRAVDKLRQFFGKRGAAMSMAGFTTLLVAHAVEAAPAGLGTSVAAICMGAGAKAAGTWGLAKGAGLMAISAKAKTVVAAGMVLLLGGGVATVVVKELWPARSNSSAVKVVTVAGSPWAMRLPNGIDMDLLAIQNNSAPEESGWKADGNPLEAWPVVDDSKYQHEPGPGCISYKLLLRAEGLATDEISLTLNTEPPWESITWRPARWSGSVRPGIYEILVDMPESAATMSLKVGVASGDWITVASNPTPQQAAALDVQFGKNRANVEFRPLAAWQKGSRFGLLYPPMQWHAGSGGGPEHRVQAMTAAGQIIGRVAMVGGIEASGYGNLIEFDVPPEKVQRLDYQVRPYRHWVEFRDISLRAGAKTQPKGVITSIEEVPQATGAAAK